MIRVLVWNEFRHEQTKEFVKKIYPQGMHQAIANFLGENEDIVVKTATLDEPEHGLAEEVLANTDVIIWWGHAFHHELSDEVAERVAKHIRCGMGAIFLHSAHYSKPFKLLMGTTCSLYWRETSDKERVWLIEPSHPIAQGLGNYFEIEAEETYGERFDIPTPDELIFISWFSGGEVFRSGCCYRRGYGRIFYFKPGHETFPIFYHEQVKKVVSNAVRWANPTYRVSEEITATHTEEPLEKR